MPSFPELALTFVELLTPCPKMSLNFIVISRCSEDKELAQRPIASNAGRTSVEEVDDDKEEEEEVEDGKVEDEEDDDNDDVLDEDLRKEVNEEDACIPPSSLAAPSPVLFLLGLIAEETTENNERRGLGVEVAEGVAKLDFLVSRGKESALKLSRCDSRPSIVSFSSELLPSSSNSFTVFVSLDLILPSMAIPSISFSVSSFTPVPLNGLMGIISTS